MIISNVFSICLLYWGFYNFYIIMGSTKTVANSAPKLLAKAQSENVEWGNFTAKLNNFDPMNPKTFSLRYIYNFQFAKEKDAPLIVFLGAEGPIITKAIESGQIFEIARENDGALFYLEHRYFGGSTPSKDYATENLKYLELRQAIEDAHRFIQFLKRQSRFQNSKIVLAGCSYSASLATWTKVTYPQEIDIIYATSGPLNTKTNMFEFLEVATKVYQKTDPECAQILEEAFKGLSDLYDSGSNGTAEVFTMLGLCVPDEPNEPYDKAAVFQQLVEQLGIAVQHGPLVYTKICRQLKEDPHEKAMDKLAAFKRNDTGDDCQYGDYDNLKRNYQNTDLKRGRIRPWFFLKCTQIGFFLTTDSDKQIFGDSVKQSLYKQLCRDAFTQSLTDERIEASADYTNLRYGGKHPLVKRAVFIYGENDPWAPMGLTHDLNPEAIVYHVEAGTHCGDLGPPSESDGKNLTNVKESARAHIKTWLNES